MKVSFPDTVSILAQQVREARVDHAAFETLLMPCNVSRCKATCCYDGVHLSGEEAAYVEKIAESDLGEMMDVDGLVIPVERGLKTATRVAEEGELADDFPQHFAKTRCVFLDKDGLCELQKLAIWQGVHPWVHKPLTCWMHPLVLIPAGKWEERPVLTIVNSQNDPQRKQSYAGYASCTHCGRKDNADLSKPARMVLEDELRMLGEICGRDLYHELSAKIVDWVVED